MDFYEVGFGKDYFEDTPLTWDERGNAIRAMVLPGVSRQNVKRVEGVAEAISDARRVAPKTKTDALKKHILNGELDAARREAAGEVVARKPNGQPWDHVTELRDAQNGLLKRIRRIKNELGDAKLDPAARRALECELSEASKLLDKTEEFLPR
ncbi:MAG: polymorphic toxin type 28 domain-containing protein [Pirellulaceae bacterium]